MKKRLENWMILIFGIKQLKDLCDYAMTHKLDYSATIDVSLNVPAPINRFNKRNLPIDVRDILACLLLEKEELENEIKGEIKNEGN